MHSHASHTKLSAAQLKRAAKKGDIDTILEQLRSIRSRDTETMDATLNALLLATEVASSQDPAAFAEQMFGRTISVSSYLAMRMHATLIQQLAWDDKNRGRAPELSQDVLDRLLPSLERLQGSLGELLLLQARTARVHGLANAKAIELALLAAGLPKTTPELSQQPTTSHDASPPTNGNGQGTNRIADHLSAIHKPT